MSITENIDGNIKRNRGRTDKMQNKAWRKFDQLTEKCYENMIGAYEDSTCWQKAFRMLVGIVENERSENKNYARELYQLDDLTDFEHDVQGWLEDYLDEMDMNEDFETVLSACDWLLHMFNWKEVSPSEICFRKATVLGTLGRAEEAHDFCMKWIKKEPEDMQAIAALVYAKMGIRDLDAAEQIVRKYINEDTECTDENDILFIAADTLYEINGNKKAKNQIKKAIEQYNDYLENHFMEDMEDDDLDFLPFN